MKEFIETFIEGLKWIAGMVVLGMILKFLALFLFSLPDWLSETMVAILVIHSFGCLSRVIDSILSWFNKLFNRFRNHIV